MEDQFLKVAQRAALEAGKIIAQYFGKNHQYNYKNKDQSDFATQADLQSEKKIVEILTKIFPSHNIIAEEGGRVDNHSEYSWAVDPLDGTFSFSIGMPYFAVSIGLLKNNKPILGVIYHVLSKDLYTGQLGKGAYINGKKVHISAKKDLFYASIALEFGHKRSRIPKIDLYIVPLLKELGHIYSTGSTAMNMALTGKGVQDAMLAQAWIWDFAAGSVIVKEAGGIVTDFAGKEPDWSQDRFNIVASNGFIHNALLEILKK
ncbi:inositol monophosphatase [Candidatus Daviesbacteria bacterium]|nr:inositol monophosphatase [Candidatus Daviesbacteria bacterium]